MTKLSFDLTEKHPLGVRPELHSQSFHFSRTIHFESDLKSRRVEPERGRLSALLLSHTEFPDQTGHAKGYALRDTASNLASSYGAEAPYHSENMRIVFAS